MKPTPRAGSVKLARFALAVLIPSAAIGLLVFAAPQEMEAIRHSQPQPFVLGALSCASTGCHGSPWPVTGGEVRQNEYVTWSEKDRHAEAYKVLLTDRSKLIARNLNLAEAHSSKICLDCHSYNLDPSRRATTFDVSEGITCEACHAPASRWLGSHVEEGRERSDLAMSDARDLVRRSELCVSCHLGDSTKTVDHELIAAGHPDLIFELDTMTALMPRHWRQKSPWEGVQQWVVGQAVALRESMRQLARRAHLSERWPEFADFECYACHHNLTPGTDGPRRQPRHAGIPPWNSSRYVVLRQSLLVLAAPSVPVMDRLVSDLGDQLRSLQSRAQVAQTAEQIASAVENLLPELTAFEFDSDSVGRIVEKIVAAAPRIRDSGIQSAEQAVMAIDSLSAAYQLQTGKTDDGLNSRIDELFDLLQSASRYDPDRFERQLEKIQLPRF